MSLREREHTINVDGDEVSGYNIPGGLGGVGKTIIAHIIHEMKDGRDIEALVSCCGKIGDVMSDKLYEWSIGRAVAERYSLSEVPLEFTDSVCIYFEWKYIFTLS